ncbi:MAG: hypothetical protein QW260_08005 [Thermoproteota archaeon]
MKYNNEEVYQICHRNRHHYWVRANNLTKEHATSYSERENLMRLLRWLAYLYVKDVKDKNIVLGGEDENKERLIKIIKYITRFSEEYIRKSRRLLKRYVKPLEKSRSLLFLTLTISFNDFETIEEGAKWSQRQKNSLLTELRKRGILPYYVSITEVQEKHTKNIHFHILILNEVNENGRIKEIISVKEFEEIVKRNWKYIFKIEKISSELKENGRPDKKYIIGYLGKYLKKSMMSSEEGFFNDTMIILWALDMRVMSCSRKKPDEGVKEDLIGISP